MPSGSCPDPTTIAPEVTYNANNQITNGGVQYDQAGEMTSDGTTNGVLYDAEGRICAVEEFPISGGMIRTEYIYNAEGQRVSKGHIASWSCDETTNGYVPESDYVLDLAGHQMTEVSADENGTMVWEHTNVYAAGVLIGTYDTNGLHFYLNDWLGTRRAQTDANGTLEQTCTSLPYGDHLSCTGSTTTPTEQHFTGKERDAESGNDYFGARYYASSMGRFLSPDWSDPAQPIPYAHFDDPQSLNLYGYVENNPLSQVDDDGHSSIIFDGQAGTITVRSNDGTEKTFPVSNNPQMSLTIGKLVDGNYAFLDTERPHHHSPSEDSHNGAYGPGGIFRLKPFRGADGKMHDGVGLHAGRADMTDRARRSGCDQWVRSYDGTGDQIHHLSRSRRPTHGLGCSKQSQTSEGRSW
ncbi:MAG: RHS repeat-associated core domain-containing protein [Acidobacteriaceae bacterium]